MVGDALRNGPKSKVARTASLSLAIPVFMNLFADFYLDAMKKSTTTTSSKSINSKDILTKPELLIFMLGIVIPPIISYFTDGNKATLLFVCSIAMQQQFVWGVVITSLNRFDADYFPTLFAYPAILLFTAATITKPYGINAVAAQSLPWDNKLPIYIFYGYVASAVGCIILSLILFWLSSVFVAHIYGEKVKSQYYRWPEWTYLHHHFPTMKSTTNTPNIVVSSGPVDDGLLYFRIMYCLTLLAWSFLTVTVHIGIIFYQFDDNALLLDVIPSIVFQLSVLFFGLRLVKHEAISALLALLEAKKSYVRYISHELRTPLSAANAGLQMLQEELSASVTTSPIDKERLDTLNDVCSAISTTVDILNDLLTFEKMER